MSLLNHVFISFTFSQCLTLAFGCCLRNAHLYIFMLNDNVSYKLRQFKKTETLDYGFSVVKFICML